MKKFAVIFLCVVLLTTAGAGATLAFFTDSESSAVSSITAGSVDVRLDVRWNRDVSADQSGTSAASDNNLDPGEPIPVSPYVTNTGTSPVYVRIRVLVPNNLAGSFEVILPTDNPGYVSQLETPAYRTKDSDHVEFLFLYNEPLAAGQTTARSVSEGFYFKPDSGTDSGNTVTPQTILDSSGISFHVDAIQASTFDSASAAFAAFDGTSSAGSGTTTSPAP